MLDIALYQPEIPPNTGNAMRLCANIGSTLHLIHPLAFEVSDKRLRRAGMDYRERAVVREHQHFEAFWQAMAGRRVFAFSSKASRRFDEPTYQSDDVLLFGPETRGLPPAVLEQVGVARTLTIPMAAGNRSLNLSNAVAVAAYEAWRQSGYAGARGADDHAGSGDTQT